MKKRIVFWGIVAVLAAGGYGGYLIFRAQNNLVTLDVRNMEVREVASKIEFQTREKIIVHKDVQGKITLNVKGVAIEEVLNIVAEQTSARWTALYPLYSTSDSLAGFKKVARGDLEVETSGWTNLLERGGFGGRGGPGGPGGFGFGMLSDAAASQSKKINLELVNRDLPFATMALARVGQSQVVPENGTVGTLNLHLQQVSYEKAVAAVAKQVHRSWDDYYLLQPGFGFGRGGDNAGNDRGGRRDFGGDNTNRFDPQFAEIRREEREVQREKAFEAQLATLTPQEQEKVKEERKQMEDLRNLSQEEREKKMQEFAARPQFQQRMEQRMYRGVMNTTPEQRADRARSRVERQQRWQQQQRNTGR